MLIPALFPVALLGAITVIAPSPYGGHRTHPATADPQEALRWASAYWRAFEERAVEFLAYCTIVRDRARAGP
jgi:hypothetical protein